MAFRSVALVLLIVLLGRVALGSPPPATPSYTVIDLGVGQGAAINDAGDVVGTLYTANGPRATMWSSSGAVTDLGFSQSYAMGVNASGVVVGSYVTEDAGGTYWVAFRWENGTTTDLGTLPDFRSVQVVGTKPGCSGSSGTRWEVDADGLTTPSELDELLDTSFTGRLTQPSDAQDRIAIAELLYEKSRPADSLRMYELAFAEDPALLEDSAGVHRYNAACVSVLVAALGGAEAAERRGRALAWLRAELSARGASAQSREFLEHWKVDADLASVRDGVATLPESEREGWRDLWKALDAALAAPPR